MKNLFKKAHEMTREMVKKYKVDYRAQFGLNLSYLLNNKEEEEMIKNYVEVKGFEIKVVGNDLFHYRNNEIVAVTENFTDKSSYMTKENLVAVVYHTKTELAEGKNGIVVTDEQFNTLIEISERIRKAIDSYFENLDNVEIGKLSNGSYFIKNKNRELETLNKNYYNEIEKKWLENNRIYIIKTKEEWVRNEMGQMESIEEYGFKKENIKAIDEKRKERESNKSESRKESERTYTKLYGLAEKLSDEDFEDVTGLRREDFLA